MRILSPLLSLILWLNFNLSVLKSIPGQTRHIALSNYNFRFVSRLYEDTELILYSHMVLKMLVGPQFRLSLQLLMRRAHSGAIQLWPPLLTNGRIG